MSQEANLYQLLFEHSAQGMVLLRSDRIELANQSFADMVGCSRDDLLGHALEDHLSLLHPQDRDMMLAQFRDRLAGKESPRYQEFRLVRRDGAIRWCAATVSLIRFQGDLAVLGALLDITERKRTEEALQESLAREKYLGDILRNASVAIAVGYPDGHIGAANAAFQELTGYSEEELKTIDWNRVLTPPEWWAYEAAQLGELNRSKTVARYEKDYVRKDGSRVPVELVVHPHLDADDNIVSYFAFVSDITGRKQAEATQKEHEAIVRALLNASTEIVLMLSVDGTILAVNEVAGRHFGKRPEELIGEPVQNILAPEVVRFREKRLLEAIRSGRSVTFEDQHASSWFVTTIFPVQDAGGKATRVVVFARDITERKQAEAAQKEHEATVRALLNAPTEMVFMLSVDGIILTLNEAAARRIGKRPEELIGTHFRTIVLPEEVESREKLFSDVARSGRPITHESQREGRWFESTVYPIQDADGRVTRLVVFAREITERKRVEAILREHEATVRALLNAPTESVLMVHVDGTVLATNETTARRLGKRPEELIGAPLQSIMAPEVARSRMEHFAEAARTGLPVTFEDRRAGMWFESTVYPIQDADGRVTRLVVFAHDISERKQAEEALRANKQLLDSIIDTVPLGIALTDGEGDFVRVNDEYCRILALKREDLLNRPFASIFPPEAVEAVRAAYRKILGGDMEVGVERAYRRRDGTLIYVDTTNSLVHDQQGAPLVVTAVRDVTALKQAEQQRVAFTLEQERMRILTDFITHASHEFRTPLSVINTSTYLLKKSADAEARQRHLSAIEAQTESIATLVEALITMLRLDSSQETFTQQVDLCGVVEGVYQRKRGEFEARHLQTGLEFKARPVIVLGDATYLSQAVACILDNALRFTPQDGAIQVRVETTGQDAVIAIADTGAGINQADLEHIFERFYRADKARTTRGLGLGLPIARAIVERHQGRIEVESALGRGSTFRVILPLRA